MTFADIAGDRDRPFYGAITGIYHHRKFERGKVQLTPSAQTPSAHEQIDIMLCVLWTQENLDIPAERIGPTTAKL